MHSTENILPGDNMTLKKLLASGRPCKEFSVNPNLKNQLKANFELTMYNLLITQQREIIPQLDFF